MSKLKRARTSKVHSFERVPTVPLSRLDNPYPDDRDYAPAFYDDPILGWWSNEWVIDVNEENDYSKEKQKPLL